MANLSRRSALATTAAGVLSPLQPWPVPPCSAIPTNRRRARSTPKGTQRAQPTRAREVTQADFGISESTELTNHLIPGIVLMPGVVVTMVELQRAGFE